MEAQEYADFGNGVFFVEMHDSYVVENFAHRVKDESRTHLV